MLDLVMSLVFQNDYKENFPNVIKIVSDRGNVYNISGVGYPLCDPICDCRGFRYTGHCKHIDKLKEYDGDFRDLRPDPGVAGSQG